MNVVSYIFTVVVAALAVFFTVYGFKPESLGSLENVEKTGFFHTPHPMEKRDLLPLILILAVYSVVAFIGLGSHSSPESLYHFVNAGDSTTLELTERADNAEILWFSGVEQSKYLVELSADGDNWTEQGEWDQASGEQLKWHSETPVLSSFRYIRITAEHSDVYLGEIAVRANGTLCRFATASPLTDDQSAVPEQISYLNSSYFDEIYHVRTAYEYLLTENIYEVSHPPLGKAIISLGIRIFGLNPFGWRFMGVFFGILMLPILYVFAKNLFGRTAVAACVTTIFAFDFMHFVQTRIATIDTYGTIFVLLMFYLMYRWLTLPLDAPAHVTMRWLFAAGLAFGVGCACKWTVVYGGAGLALIWLIRVALLIMHRRKKAVGQIFGLVGASVCFFILIPALIYCASYQPYGAADGVRFFSRDYFKIVWDNQQYMYHYHSTLKATHPYQSRWWKWVLDIRPILYYLVSFDDGTKSAFAAFGNPLFWWAGLGCMASIFWTMVRRRDAIAALILIGWLSELVPWIGITRCTFIYHYFPCTIFLALAVGYQMEGMCRRAEAQERARLTMRANMLGIEPIAARHVCRCDKMIFIFTALCLLMFVLFYPALTGVRFSTAYMDNFLRWFKDQYPF